MKNYISLSPALTWTIPQSPSASYSWFVPGAPPNIMLAAGDIDGDLRKELVVINPTAPALSLISYFEYGDITPQWADNIASQLVNYFAQSTIAGPTSTDIPSWTISQQDQVWCANVDGDSQDEILIFNPASQRVGLLKWNDNTLQCSWATDNQIPGSTGEGGWNISSLDKHIVGDFDKDGTDEILVYNLLNQGMGLLKWNGSELQCIWIAQQGRVPGNNAGDWNIFAEDKYFAADLDGDKCHEVLAYSAMESPDILNRSVGVLKWSGTEMQCIWRVDNQISPGTGGGFWGISAKDQYLPADINGDGKAEVLVFNPDALWTGVLEWNGSELQCVWVVKNHIPNSATNEPAWSMSLLDQRFTADFNLNHKSDVLIFNPINKLMGLLEWNGSELQCAWVDNQIPSSTGNGGWNIDSPDQYFVTDFNGDGIDEIVVINPLTQGIGALQWAGSELQNTWSVTSNFPAWNLGLLASGPTTPFPYSPIPITGTHEQETIYQYISESISEKISSTATDDIRSLYPKLAAKDFEAAQQALDNLSNDNYDAPDWNAVVVALSQDFSYGYISDSLNPECQSDIRGEYDNLNDKGNFSGYAGNASSLATNPPEAFIFNTTDPYGRYQLFSNLALQISTECSCIDSIMDLIENMGDLAGELKSAQEGQLNTVVANITETVDPTKPTVSQFAWWMGQVADALLWGAAAIQFGENTSQVNIAISITASLFGSILSSGTGGSNPPPPSVLLSEVESQLDTIYVDAIINNSNDEEIVLNDPIMLCLVNQLTQNAWQWRANSDVSTLSQKAEDNYRLYFYQHLLPISFEMMIWSNISLTEPSYMAEVGHKGEPMYENIGAPSYAYLTVPNDDKTNNIYMLYQGSDKLSDYKEFKYPSQAIMNDLFQTLGVSQSEFFAGANGWNIPTVDWRYGQ